MIRICLLLLLGSLSTSGAAHKVPDLRGEILVDGNIVASLEQAEQQIRDGSIIQLGSGTFPNGIHIRHNNVTLSGSGKTHFISALTEGKAAIITSGKNITIRNVECSRMSNQWGNGACIRHLGENLTVENVYFHDSENGILEAPNEGVLRIKSSRFERLGYRGRAHGVYTSGSELKIENSTFISAVSEGHEIKSRSKRTVILSTIIASGAGYDSRLIDVPNGGELIVTDSILVQNNNSSNPQLIGYGVEGMKNERSHSVLISNNLVVMKRDKGSTLIGFPREEITSTIKIRDNTFVGQHSDIKRWGSDNTYHEKLKELNQQQIQSVEPLFNSK